MMLLLTLRGTPTMYYGDEIGMVDGIIPPDRIQDPWEIFVPGIGLGRDPERTPMQWDSSENAGFCEPDVLPWLPVGGNKTAVNTTTQQSDPTSMLTMTRKLIQLRQNNPALHSGAFQSLAAPDELFAYMRTDGEQQFLVVLNFSHRPQSWMLPVGVDRLLLSTVGNEPEAIMDGVLHLRPNEGLLFTL